MHSRLYHSVVSNCQVNHNRCLLQYSLDLWSLDFLHIHDRAVFDLHQTPNLDSNDRKFHCDSPLEYDFEMYCGNLVKRSFCDSVRRNSDGKSSIHLNNYFLTICTQKAFATRCTGSNSCMWLVKVVDIRSCFMPHIVLYRCFFNLSWRNIGLRCCSLVIYFRLSCFSADCWIYMRTYLHNCPCFCIPRHFFLVVTTSPKFYTIFSSTE